MAKNEKMAVKNRASSKEKEPKRLLRRQGPADEYFDGHGWTTNPEQAKCFIDSLEAAQVCARHNLTRVEMAIRVDLKGSDIFCTPVR